MENEFKEVMSKRSDEELINIITEERGGYNLIAIEAAEFEIKKRNIDSNQFSEIKEKLTSKKKEKEKIDSNIANSTSRFVNYIIDIIAWYVLAYIFAIVLGFFYQPSFPNGTRFYALIVLIASFFMYFVIMEVMFQKTLGKFVTKTKVVKENGEKPEVTDIVARTFCRLIPLEQFSFLINKNGLHDILSKTKVVYDKI